MNVSKITSPISKRIFKKDYEKLMQFLSNKVGDLIVDIELTNNTTLLDILVLGEDRRFYMHIGFDIKGIFRAFYKNIVFKKREGGSTIEQQLVRVIICDYEISFKRKIKEIFLATILSSVLSKKNILISYLQVAYYGQNMLGYKSAINSINRDGNKRNELETAIELVARIKYPEIFNNINRKHQIENRKKFLLKLYNRTKYGKN
jgi:membrane peptidoglycan carboxypeptidase